MTTDNKKRKKPSITEGTGGSHAASVVTGGPIAGENERGYTLAESVSLSTSNVITYCPVCKRSYGGDSYYGHNCIN